MDKVKKNWKKVPRSIRKPVIFFLGLTLVIFAPVVGWVPGPGGMIVFLLGIAILATEFVWAENVKNRILAVGKAIGHYVTHHRRASIILSIIAVILSICFTYAFYTYII